MPCGPLADDWLFWDPETIFAYPHSRELDARIPHADGGWAKRRDPEQLELFESPNE